METLITVILIAGAISGTITDVKKGFGVYVAVQVPETSEWCLEELPNAYAFSRHHCNRNLARNLYLLKIMTLATSVSPVQ